MPGWSGGAMVLGKLPGSERPANLDFSRARTYCACSRCGWGLFGHFSLIYHFSLLSPSLWETVRYRLKYCLKGRLTQNNQLTYAWLNRGSDTSKKEKLLHVSMLDIFDTVL